MEMLGDTSPQGGQVTQIPDRHNLCVRLPRARAVVDGKGGVVREGFMEVAQTEVGSEERGAREWRRRDKQATQAGCSRRDLEKEMIEDSGH